MLTQHVALVSQTPHITPAELMRVSAAIQKQAVNDFGPIWEIHATVNAFATLTDVPPGYWPVVVRDDIGLNLAGAHWNDTHDKPFSLVTYREEDWPLSASHEVLEMLADPFGKTFITGPSLLPDQGTVEYLIEVCDPCQGEGFGYAVNGIVVADFVLPAYYKAFADGQYSFAGHVTEARQVLDGGYVSWRDPVSGNWSQFLFSDAGPEFRDLGPNPAPLDIHLRGFLDRATTAYMKVASSGKKKRKPRLNHPTAKNLCAHAPAIRKAVGERWQTQIDRVVKPQSG